MGKLSSIFLSVLVVLAASCTRPGISVMMCEGAEQPISVGTSTPEYLSG